MIDASAVVDAACLFALAGGLVVSYRRERRLRAALERMVGDVAAMARIAENQACDHTLSDDERHDWHVRAGVLQTTAVMLDKRATETERGHG